MEYLSVRATVLMVAFIFPLQVFVDGMTRHYKFDVVLRNTTRLCSSKPIVTVNGKFPGPTLYAREDDNILVKVTNHVNYNITIHWHGVRLIRTGWSDGPAYITQCPIQPCSRSFVYNFTLTGQRGTLFYHAHILWLRATLHGAIVILPKRHVPYPFPKPHKEVILVLGEWWKSDTEAVINEAMQSGLAPNVSDAHTINGYPGPTSSCPSSGDGLNLKVDSGKTYMLRIINAALNEELFFKVAGHSLTVIEVDALYTKPFTTDTLLLTPGQTTNALLTADKSYGTYLVAVSPFLDTSFVAVDDATATATLRYTDALTTSAASTPIPSRNATPVANTFITSLRSLNSNQYPAIVPLSVDHSLLFTVGLGVNPCANCVNGSRVVGAINNVSFVMPSTALLQAQYFSIPGVFTSDFPGNPAVEYNYTGGGPASMATNNGTRLYRIAYNSTVQVVLQDTGVIEPENHPIHLCWNNQDIKDSPTSCVRMGLSSYKKNLALT